MDDDAGLEQLVVLFPNVPRKVVAQTYRQSGRDFDRALAAVLRVAPDWEPSPDAACAAAQKELLSAAETETELQALFPASTRDEVAAALRVSGGSSELAVDVLLASSEQGQLSQSVADIAHVFGLSTADVEVDFSAHGNSVDAVVDALLRRSQSGAVPVPPDDRAASIDFLRTMFPSEAPDVLDGLLDAHQSLDDVVDFLLSLDLLKGLHESKRTLSLFSDSPARAQCTTASWVVRLLAWMRLRLSTTTTPRSCSRCER